MIELLYRYLNQNMDYFLMKYHHTALTFSDAECMKIYKEYILRYPCSLTKEEFHILIKMIKTFLSSGIDQKSQQYIYSDYCGLASVK